MLHAINNTYLYRKYIITYTYIHVIEGSKYIKFYSRIAQYYIGTMLSYKANDMLILSYILIVPIKNVANLK